MQQLLKTLLLLILIVSVNTAFCQQSSSRKSGDDEKVFNVDERMPEFPGGNYAVQAFLEKNFRVPESKRNITASFKIFTEVEIDKTGRVKKPRVIKGAESEMKKEMLRVFKIMPKWKPATLNGKPISMKLIIPFTLST